jgi:hypothetical protein
MKKKSLSKTATKAASAATTEAPSMNFGAMLDEMVGSGVHSAIAAIEEIVHEKLQNKGPQVLDKALKETNKATHKLIKWSKKHPVKTAAAAAALIGVSAFIYSTMKKAELHAKS